MNFSYIGRPDGLGNRLEEIIRLEAICQQSELKCEYIWQNKRRDRTYQVHINTKHVKITDSRAPEFPVKNLSDFESTLSQSDVLSAAKSITPSFDIQFSNITPPVGIHIRGTDRIGLDHPHFMKDENELKGYITEAANQINKRKPENVYVSSESKKWKKRFIKLLETPINVVDTEYDRKTPLEYVELFGLSLCSEIWMVSRFSSFSVTASLIGNVPLVTFVNDPEVRKRYQALFNYVSFTG